MKNIHILPTDKLSRLFLKENTLLLNNQYTLQKIFTKGKCQHIYITSDEEIKDGDWLLIIDDFETYVHKHKGDNLPTTYYKKIILTTDQDLIKDGVQAIDDEFLVWFVKNPSCEKVEVCKNPFYEESNYEHYKIIIPQEEDEQEEEEVECNMCDSLMSYDEENGIYICTNSECTRCYEEYEEEPKQETLEDDLIRRDFTLNAMAEDIDGNLIDLFDGRWALENKLLITPLDTKVTFDDDPLRILRAIRFSIVKGFEIPDDMWHDIYHYDYESKMGVVSAERIREELLKCFKHDTLETLEKLRQFTHLKDYIFKKTNLWLKPTFEK
jgi:hypothetical protein